MQKESLRDMKLRYYAKGITEVHDIKVLCKRITKGHDIALRYMSQCKKLVIRYCIFLRILKNTQNIRVCSIFYVYDGVYSRIRMC